MIYIIINKLKFNHNIKVNTSKPILRNLHAETISKAYAHCKTHEGKRNIINGWSAAGIVKALKNIRDSQHVIKDTNTMDLSTHSQHYR